MPVLNGKKVNDNFKVPVLNGKKEDDDFKVEEKADAVNHPAHYNREGSMECFDEFVMIYGVEAAKIACLFNVHKYRYRAANKNGIEDLHKSDWYMNKYAELSKKETCGSCKCHE